MKKKARFLSALLAVLVMLCAMPFSVSADLWDYVDSYNGYVYYEGSYIEFTPEYSGWYGFYSVCDYDVKGNLYDEYGNEMDYADDNFGDYQFYLKGYLYEGETYEVDIYAYGIEEGDEYPIDIYVVEATGAYDAELLQEPDDNTVIEGMEYESLSFEGVEVGFTFDDGEYVTWSYDYDGFGDDLYNYSEVEWDFFYDEYDEILVEDGCVYVWVECDDAYVVLEYVLVENPVDSIEVDCEPIVYYENTNGEYDEDHGSFYYYVDVDDDAEITVYYKDGTSFTANIDEVINGYSVQIYSEQYTDPWTIGGDNCVYVEYMDHITEIPVEILYNPVESMEVTQYPDMYDYDWAYYPLWGGAEITLYYKDGTEVSEVLDDDYVQCDVYNREFLFYVDGYPLTISYDYSNEDSDVERYIFECMGYVDYLDFEPKNLYEVAEMTVRQISDSGENTIIDVVYKNGEEETFEFDVIDYYFDYFDDEMGNVCWYAYGWTRTQNGYAGYSVDEVCDENGDVIGYEVYFLGAVAYADVDLSVDVGEPVCGIFGDADLNGTVNVRDATAIQKHIADVAYLEYNGIILGDVDYSDILNIRDATAIQKWVAGIDVGYPIGDEIFIYTD